MTHEELTISCTGFMVEKLKKNGITGDILQVDIKRSTYKDK